jgi:NhaP-type Na+/H+ or K+/H+ antiporter
MINDALVDLGMGFLVVALVGVVLSLIGWAMTRSAERKEGAPELSDIKVGKPGEERIH